MTLTDIYDRHLELQAKYDALKDQYDASRRASEYKGQEQKERIARLVEAGWVLNEVCETRRLGQPVSKEQHGRLLAARAILTEGKK